MSIIVQMRRQPAIYWRAPGTDAKPSWALPVSTKVRWEDKVREHRDPIHELSKFQAEVFVGMDVARGDYLALGNLTGSTSQDPRQTSSYEVLGMDKTPNFKATEVLRKAVCAPSPLALVPLRPFGLEAVNYFQTLAEPLQPNGVVNPRVGDVSTIAVPVALRGRPETAVKDVERFSGFQAGVCIWEVPQVYLPAEPSSEDYIVDSFSTRWNVVKWEEGTLRTWWKIHTKRGSL